MYETAAYSYAGIRLLSPNQETNATRYMLLFVAHMTEWRDHLEVSFKDVQCASHGPGHFSNKDVNLTTNDFFEPSALYKKYLVSNDSTITGSPYRALFVIFSLCVVRQVEMNDI